MLTPNLIDRFSGNRPYETETSILEILAYLHLCFTQTTEKVFIEGTLAPLDCEVRANSTVHTSKLTLKYSELKHSDDSPLYKEYYPEATYPTIHRLIAKAPLSLTEVEAAEVLQLTRPYYRAFKNAYKLYSAHVNKSIVVSDLTELFSLSEHPRGPHEDRTNINPTEFTTGVDYSIARHRSYLLERYRSLSSIDHYRLAPLMVESLNVVLIQELLINQLAKDIVIALYGLVGAYNAITLHPHVDAWSKRQETEYAKKLARIQTFKDPVFNSLHQRMKSHPDLAVRNRFSQYF
jgi:hypothetical protein